MGVLLPLHGDLHGDNGQNFTIPLGFFFSPDK